MDKRVKLYQFEYQSDRGIIPVTVYEKSGGYRSRMLARTAYGELTIYATKYNSKKSIYDFAERVIQKNYDTILNRPFYKDFTYIYMLGKKRYFTYDSFYKENENYFYLPKTTKDPLTRYKKLFLEYLSKRVVEIGKIMGVDLSSWKIRTGLFLTYSGCCFPTKHQFKFDYRVFAFQPQIIDSIIVHEISHIFVSNHDNLFYSIVKYYCPGYDELQSEFQKGYFEGEYDYVISRH